MKFQLLKPDARKSFDPYGYNKYSGDGKSWILIGLISIQIFLTMAMYNAVSAGLYNLSQLWLGINLMLFVAMLLISRFSSKNKRFTWSKLGF
jgi:hypothetical protein